MGGVNCWPMRTKKEYIRMIQEMVPGMSLKQIGNVLKAQELVVRLTLNLGPRNERVVTIPGLVKLRAVVRDPRPERRGRNPATGQRMIIPARPAETKVRARVLPKIVGPISKKAAKVDVGEEKLPPTRFEREPVI